MERDSYSHLRQQHHPLDARGLAGHQGPEDADVELSTCLLEVPHHRTRLRDLQSRISEGLRGEPRQVAPVRGIKDKRREDENGDAIHRNGLEAGEAGGNQEDILFLDLQGGSTDPSLEDVMGQ